METEPDYSAMTDRNLSELTERQSRQALTIVGTMQSDWNTICADNRMLLSNDVSIAARIVKLEEEVTDLRAVVMHLLEQILPAPHGS